MLNILTHMELSVMSLQTMRHGRREDEALWSGDSIERHYTYSRKRLPRYREKYELAAANC